jgi:Uma2 family endonuclease
MATLIPTLATTEDRLLTVEEFEAIADSPEYKDRLVELVDGKIHEILPTEEHGVVTANAATVVQIYGRQNQIKGRTTILARHRSPDDNRNVRLPDVSYTSAARLLPMTKKGSVPQMPDFVIEIKSPDDTYEDMRESAKFYIQNGVSLVWLLYPAKRLVEVYRAGGDSEIYTEHDVLEGGAVLPGFTLSVAELFRED